MVLMEKTCDIFLAGGVYIACTGYFTTKQTKPNSIKCTGKEAKHTYLYIADSTFFVNNTKLKTILICFLFHGKMFFFRRIFARDRNIFLRLQQYQPRGYWILCWGVLWSMENMPSQHTLNFTSRQRIIFCMYILATLHEKKFIVTRRKRPIHRMNYKIEILQTIFHIHD